ncbi:HSP20 family protein [Paraburkholderia sp. BL27I4N3]|uniref:Hsp20/alpha crystallin family protein n=1 Tax=Paraburkholderia sp. BL27I4N3 TaxID=1938805 RepID=UPI000E27AEFD|nr:Hsp20/alpha crystallin family protein [Paraburkholderia sp. BL27I4N3]REE21742.1 HSP20 family protein [Paraburkholderia sp. BL27I4N3]RKR38874.1 HSP20 family protein [Paraburkholderia sp. BL17N1]
MLLDLDKWNPFRFLRSDSAQEKASGPAGASRTSQQSARQNTQQTGGTQTGDGAPMATAAAPAALASASWPLPDPIHLFAELIRDPFGGRGPLGSWFGDFSASEFQPRIDVTDEGDALRIVAELPGMTRDDVELEVIEDMLIISGQKRFESTSEEQGCYRVERSFGDFQRAVPLPSGIDLDRAEARFENGVLTLRVPKAAAEPAAKRRIEIK